MTCQTPIIQTKIILSQRLEYHNEQRLQYNDRSQRARPKQLQAFPSMISCI